MGRQYWADCATKNNVWLFQVRRQEYGEDGCTCGAFDHKEGEPTREKCTCAFEYWQTENVFLLREEAREHGKARSYAWGEEGKGWRIYGVMCIGLMAELLGQHVEEFEDKVEYISPVKIMGHVEGCMNSSFEDIECLESKKQYGFFKDDNDIRPSSCTWIGKEDAEKLWRIFK